MQKATKIQLVCDLKICLRSHQLRELEFNKSRVSGLTYTTSLKAELLVSQLGLKIRISEAAREKSLEKKDFKSRAEGNRKFAPEKKLGVCVMSFDFLAGKDKKSKSRRLHF